MHPLLSELKSIDLPSEDWALFGSGPLLVRGWIKEAGDLDVIARGKAWDYARQKGDTRYLEEHDIEVVSIGSHITVGNRWAIGEFDVNLLIDTAERIKDIPCVTLEHIMSYKLIADRPKDRDHLDVMASRLKVD